MYLCFLTSAAQQEILHSEHCSTVEREHIQQTPPSPEMPLPEQKYYYYLFYSNLIKRSNVQGTLRRF